MVYSHPETVEVKKSDLRRLYRLAEDIQENNIPHACPDSDESVKILRRLLQMDRFDGYEPMD